MLARLSRRLWRKSLGGLDEILRSVAEELGAYGCMLWKLTPHSRVDPEAPAGQIFVLGQWFDDGRTFWLSEQPGDSLGGTQY